jgi:hypothetical protein
LDLPSACSLLTRWRGLLTLGPSWWQGVLLLLLLLLVLLLLLLWQRQGLWLQLRCCNWKPLLLLLLLLCATCCGCGSSASSSMWSTWHTPSHR